MNRGIYLSLSSSRQPQSTGGRKLHALDFEDERIERMLRKSRRMGNARSFDPDRPELVARATRLSNLYGASLDSELARKGAGDRRYRGKRHRVRPLEINHRGGLYSSGSSSDQEAANLKSKASTRKQSRTLRCALRKAGEVALRYTLEVSAGMKAFDGPPLGPGDVKDLLLRNFRMRLSTPEAIALIAFFTNKKECRADRVQNISIEHGEFIHAIRRLRRELLKAQGNNTFKHQPLTLTLTTGGLEATPVDASVPVSSKQSDLLRTAVSGRAGRTTEKAKHPVDLSSGTSRVPQKRADGIRRRQSLNIAEQVLARVERAAAAYDRTRTESLRQADLSRATSPRAFEGALLARFDVNFEHPLERRALEALLRDEDGKIDVERFREYFLNLIDNRAGEEANVENYLRPLHETRALPA